MKQESFRKVKKFLPHLILIIAGLYLCAMLLSAYQNQYVSDFSPYYNNAAFAFKERPKLPYTNQQPFPPYYYPPPSVFFFAPLLLTSPETAKNFFSLFSLLAVFASVILVVKIMKVPLSDLQKSILFAAVAFFHPLWFTITDGQINGFLLLLIVLGLYWYLEGHDVRSGLSLCTAAIFKITPALLIFYFLLKGRWKIFLTAALLFLGLSLLAELHWGQNINWVYWRYIVNDVAAQGGEAYRDQSLNAFLLETHIPQKIWRYYLSPWISIPKMDYRVFNSLVSYAITGLVALFVLIRSVKNKVFDRQKIIMEYALLTLVAVIGSGLSWFHHYTLLLLPFIIVLLRIFALPSSSLRRRLILLTLLAYVLMAINLEKQFDNLSDLLVDTQKSVMFYGAAILFGMLIYFRYKNENSLRH